MILSCQNLKKAFGTVSVIREASFHIEDREKAALVGPNGAGKSTLLKMITGELSPDEGLTSSPKGKCWDIWLSTRSLTPTPPFMKRYEKSEPTFWNGSRKYGPWKRK